MTRTLCFDDAFSSRLGQKIRSGQMHPGGDSNTHMLLRNKDTSKRVCGNGVREMKREVSGDKQPQRKGSTEGEKSMKTGRLRRKGLMAAKKGKRNVSLFSFSFSLACR